MSSVSNQLTHSPIERWVKKVEFVSSADLEDLGDSSSGLTSYNWHEMVEVVDRIQLAKRSKPSYQ